MLFRIVESQLFIDNVGKLKRKCKSQHCLNTLKLYLQFESIFLTSLLLFIFQMPLIYFVFTVVLVGFFRIFSFIFLYMCYLIELSVWKTAILKDHLGFVMKLKHTDAIWIRHGILLWKEWPISHISYYVPAIYLSHLPSKLKIYVSTGFNEYAVLWINLTFQGPGQVKAKCFYICCVFSLAFT